MVDAARYSGTEERKTAAVRRWGPLAWVGVGVNAVALGYTCYRGAVNISGIGVLNEAFIATTFAVILALLGAAALIGWRRWFTRTRSGDGCAIMLLVTAAYAVAAFSGLLTPEFHEIRNLL